MAVPAAAMAAGKMAGSAIGQVGIQLALEKAFFNKDVKNTVKNTESAFAKGFGNVEKSSSKTFSAIGGIIKTAFTVVGIGAITQFAKTAVNAASETQAAWTGLNSILTGTGKSFAEGKEFIDEYISDGLVPLQNAVTSYKNLAARGYSTEQIEKTMLALKDAAAFGRQASYGYGEAIQTATEGLKNENSILVDNAGVTKNVAKMWDEYAASIGTTANNLTQQQKIQAEVDGILKETVHQMGDAKAYANTFAGSIARVNTAFYNFKVAVGKFVGPIVQLFLPYIEMALNALTRFFNKLGQVLKVFGLEMPDVVSKASTTINNVGTSASQATSDIASTGDAATKAAKKINKAFSNVDEINVLNNKKDSDSGSSGSSGGSGSGGLGDIGDTVSDLTEIGEVTESLDSGAVKWAKKIKEFFEPLTKIDLSNLKNAFNDLKESAAPLGEKLFSGLKWLWDEVLVPFTTWTIEDAIPAFFEALAGALDLFNGVIDYAKPYLQFLWEDFLQPIAKWTGGMIVDVLKWIGDKLSVIGKWLSNHAPDIKEVREELEPFTNLLEKLAELTKAIYDRMKPTIDLITGQMKVGWEYVLKPLLSFIFERIWSNLKSAATVIGGILDVLIGIVSLDFEKVKKGIEDIWNAIKKHLIDTANSWKDFGKKFITGIQNGIKEAFGNVSTWVKNHIWNPIKKAWDSLKTTLGINTKDKTEKKDVSGWWTKIKNWWGDRKLSIGSSNKTEKKQVSGWWTTIKNWWGSKKLSISSSMSTAKSTVSRWWSNIKSWWGNKTLSLSVSIGKVTGSIKSWFNDKLIKPLNKKLPSFIPKIPYLAQGGWLKANNPQLAIVGDNKHEPEIVSPESKIREQVVKGIQEAGGTNNQQIEFTINVKYEDGRSIIKKINNTQIKDGKISLLV